MKRLRVHAWFGFPLLLGLWACESGGGDGADAGQRRSTGGDDPRRGISAGVGGGQGFGGSSGAGGSAGQGGGGPGGVCGDGMIDPGESCDNGPANADNAPCTLACKNAFCGDLLVLQGVEECDRGAANANDGGCKPDCKIAFCGDGLVRQNFEQCDSGAANANNGACTLACKNAVCGDGLVQQGVELCDDGNAVSGDGCEVGCTPSGMVLWQHVTQDRYASVAVDASGNILVTGATPNGSTLDVLTRKYDPSGVILWSSVYDGSGSLKDEGYNVAVDAAGNPVVAGYETLADGTTNILVCKYDGATGAILWSASFDGGVNKNDSGGGIAVNAAGDIFVTGRVTAPQSPVWDFKDDPDIFRYKLSGIDGSIVWSTIYGQVDKTDYGTDVAVDASGAVLFGAVQDFGPSIPTMPMFHGGVSRVIDNGTTFTITGGWWGPTDFVLSGIAAIGSTDMAVTGADRVPLGVKPDNAVTYKVSAAGSQLWKAADQGPSNFDGGVAVAPYPNGDLIVVGYAKVVTWDWMVRKYSASGAELWTQLFNGAANDIDGASDVALDAAGAIYVVGFESTASGKYLGVLRKLPP
ncbi:hypothetical protein [Polyangium aurulentum]|uniref:hypothetical protein n=1 Tax=Polyangium aurulentum TaxID=2567896 RepID=UPI0010AE4B20|nr:hypothetical protein [Polyangium aurulentum]UQA54890.1 hypothetical protein E8A73_026375 [Polyangium aurulentum]